MWHWNLMDDLKNNRAPLLYYIKLCASFQNHWWIQTGVTVQKRSIRVKNDDLFVSRDLEIWWMTLKINRAPLLYYVKPCASFQSHGLNQIGVTVRKRPIPVKIGDCLSRVTLKCEGWSWKTIGHIFNTTSNFVHHFKDKLELQSRNAQFTSKSAIFFVLCDLEIWHMILKNNRAPVLCYFKLCTSFRIHWWIQTGVTVQKRPIWVWNDDFFSHVTLKFDRWPWKTIGHLS